MSYILEALKKSEQERNPEKVPDLSTHHHHVTEQKTSKNKYWVRCPGQEMRINGELYHEVGPLEPDSEIETGFGAFRWEKADAQK